MTKLIIALHGTGLDARLAAPELRNALAAAGATAVALNLDDADVAPAMMRFGPAARITALVSVWTEGDPAAAVGTVADAAEEPAPHAYRVREHVRLDPLPVPDGTRSDALADIALLRRPESMPRAEYLRYWLVHHTPIAIRTQNTVAYIQNVVEETLTPAAPEIAAVVEEHFPMAAMTDPHAFYGSGGDQAELDRRITELMASVARFGADTGLDLVPTSRYHWNL
ncbi:EthD domain-containing protein [Nocardia testacea]|uniref:EthD domain-containing protein n=1 Tax=Nocardia testacea TaxID=248551 RepID=UPI00030914A7|nr:EthD domain-containing protein [Nocardia testacea]